MMNELIETKEILTRDEVMESLKIGRSTFYKLIHEGKLKGYKDGNKFKVLSTSVNDYIADKMKTEIPNMSEKADRYSGNT